MGKLTRMQGVSGSIRSQKELKKIDETTYDVLDYENKWLENLKRKSNTQSKIQSANKSKTKKKNSGLKTGAKVLSETYGKGIIVKIEESNAGKKIHVDFNGDRRCFLSKIAMRNNTLKLI